MGFRRTSLFLYIFFIFHLQHNLFFVSSRPSTVDTNDETLPFNASNPDFVGVEGKTRELAVVIKRSSGGGRGGGSSSRGGGVGSSSGRGSGSSRGIGGGARSRSRGGAGVIYPAGSHSHHSSGSMSLQGAVCAVGWLGLSVLAGLFLA